MRHSFLWIRVFSTAFWNVVSDMRWRNYSIQFLTPLYTDSTLFPPQLWLPSKLFFVPWQQMGINGAIGRDFTAWNLEIHFFLRIQSLLERAFPEIKIRALLWKILTHIFVWWVSMDTSTRIFNYIWVPCSIILGFLKEKVFVTDFWL